MSKSKYAIGIISKTDAASILLTYHYLKDISKGFKSGYNYGLFKEGDLVGCAIFTGFAVPEVGRGMLGLERNDQSGLFELSRFCLIPEIQEEEHNIATWFLSRAIKMLRKKTKVRVLLSYADSSFHSGVIYAASNFNYYGLTDPKPDFWIEHINDDGEVYYIKHVRGKTKGVKGKWLPRSQKHRFVIIYDNTLRLRMKWKRQKWNSVT